MVTVYDGRHFYGMSTDTKPADIGMNGADFTEMDTGDVYYFDGDSGDWIKPTPATQDSTTDTTPDTPDSP